MVLTYNYDTARPGKGELGDFLQVGFLVAPQQLWQELFTLPCVVKKHGSKNQCESSPQRPPNPQYNCSVCIKVNLRVSAPKPCMWHH